MDTNGLDRYLTSFQSARRMLIAPEMRDTRFRKRGINIAVRIIYFTFLIDEGLVRKEGKERAPAVIPHPPPPKKGPPSIINLGILPITPRLVSTSRR